MDIIFNNSSLSSEQIRSELENIVKDPEIITQNGGFLFKSSLTDNTFYFGIIPAFIDGQRTYHYNINTGDNRALIGFINTDSSLTIIFKLTPEEYRNGLSDELKNEYKRQYKALAQFLIDHAFPDDYKISSITSDLLLKTGLFKEKINTISDLLKNE